MTALNRCPAGREPTGRCRPGSWLIAVLAVGPVLPGCASAIVSSVAFHPARLADSFPAPSHPWAREDFFESRDGVRLQAYVVEPPRSDRRLLYLHGNAGTALDRLPEALRLGELGIAVLVLEYRGFGKSSGRPSERGVYLDARAALRYAAETLGWEPGGTFVLGESIGSAVAIDLAAEEEVAGLVLLSPLASGRDMARQMGLGWLAWVTGRPFDSERKIARVRCPLLVVHGAEDRVVPIEQGRRIHDACRSERKLFLEVPGAGHDDLGRVAGSCWRPRIHEFLDAAQAPDARLDPRAATGRNQGHGEPQTPGTERSESMSEGGS